MNGSLVVGFVALMASYGRWLYLVNRLWVLLEKENRFLYDSLGKPTVSTPYFGGTVLKFLFSQRSRTTGSAEFRSFCRRMRWFFVFHVIFSVGVTVFLLIGFLRLR